MLKNIRKTKIVCTIGPATETVDRMRDLMNSGMSCARINYSHGGYEGNKEKIERILAVRKELDLPVALALDTKGPEIRTGFINNCETDKVEIFTGQDFTFKYDEVPGNNMETSISYKNLYKEIKRGDKILVADGTMEFTVEAVEGQDIKTKVTMGGKLGSHKNVNVPGVYMEQPALSDQDKADIIAGVHAGADIIFASFVRRADDVNQMRQLLNENGGKDVAIISKIESEEGIKNFDEILALSDGIMVARGDMGVEIPLEQVPIVQKKFIRRCNEEGKPVITATQMLESMIQNSRPTRAEVSDVANAVYDQTSCIMLSGESATGQFPITCVRTMDKISRAIEENLNYWGRFASRDFKYGKDNVRANICYSSLITARDMQADCILTYTFSGYTANVLSGLRPECPIIAFTDQEKTYYKLAITQNVMPILVESKENINDMISEGIQKVEAKGIISKGDRVMIVGGSNNVQGGKEALPFGSFMVI